MQLGRILWVDDEVDSLQSQQIFLTQKGYEVVTFTNGYDAVEYLGSSAIDNAIDVVLLDETMPAWFRLKAPRQWRYRWHSIPNTQWRHTHW